MPPAQHATILRLIHQTYDRLQIESDANEWDKLYDIFTTLVRRITTEGVEHA